MTIGPTGSASSDRDAPIHAARDRGFLLHERGELGAAEQAYREVLRHSPNDVEVMHALGVLALQSGRYGVAFDLITSVIRVNETAAAHGDLGTALLGLSRFAEAIRSYDRAIELHPDFASALMNRGHALRSSGRSLEALASYDRAIILRSDFAPVYLDRSTLLLELNRWAEALSSVDKAIFLGVESAAAHTIRGLSRAGLNHREEALESYDHAISLQPDYAPAHINRGVLLRGLGRCEEAIASLDESIALQPDSFEAFANRSAALMDLNRFDQALVDCDRTIALRPDRAEGYLNRAAALVGLRRFEPALVDYGKAIAIKGDVAEVHFNRGDLLEKLQRWDAALASFDEALAIKSDYAEAHLRRGNLLAVLKQWDAALASYDRAISFRPDYGAAYVNRGNVLKELDQWDAALGSYEVAVAVEPNLAETYSNRGAALGELQRYVAAIASYDKALALKPDVEFLFGERRHARMRICDWTRLDAEVAELAARVERDEAVGTPFVTLSLIDSSSLQRKAAQVWVRRRCPVNHALPAIPKYTRHEKIRLGYFSADYHDHATMYLMAGLFEMHDRSTFDVTAFSFGPRTQDEMRRRLTAACENFIDVRQMADRDVALLARSLQVDIAVDLKGFSTDGRPGIFAMRAAPIQVNYLGYPGTMGAGYMDYLIADPTIVPEDSRRHYGEKIIYLPDSYQVNDPKRRIADKAFAREELGLPRSGFVFCCFNNSYKIMPATFEGWMRVLKRVDGSVLWLLEDNSAATGNLRQEAVQLGVRAERLIFAKRMPLPEHLARHRLADLFLDTLPCNAHTTASDALWAGLPVLTRMGDAFAGRVAASLLKAVNLPELITTNQSEYEALAVELATNPVRLAEIKRKLADGRRTEPLFDTRRYTRHLETAFKAIYERYRADSPPEHTYVDC